MPTLAAAALTTTLTLGAFVATPNYRHPVPFAKELMTLDAISGGDCTLPSAQLCERIHRAGELGYTDVVIPWPRAQPPHAGSESIVERLADRLTDGAPTAAP